ncbi:MAG TPA: hypothetical protein VFY79_07935 [Dehalococcoidia bacterium]|nr:hypothetical protein [Dehalococcoidia bacterium]
MSFVPIILGIAITVGLLVAIGIMAWDTGQQAAAEREPATRPEATPAKPEDRTAEPVEHA